MLNTRTVTVLTLILILVAAVAQAQTASFVAPADGATVVGPEVTVKWASQGVDIRAADGQRTAGEGHYHLILLEGKDAPLDLAAGEPIGTSDTIIHTTETSYTFNLSPGDYTLHLVVGDGQHIPVEPALTAVVHFKVVSLAFLEPAEGATIWGNVIRARWLSDGIDIQPADGQHTDGVGHYHLILYGRKDAKLKLKAGEPIGENARTVHTTDSEYLFENVQPGPYTLYVVIADGQHIPDDPPLARSVQFNVVPVEAGSAVRDTPWWLLALIVGAIVGAAVLLRQ